jgi:D-serine deaminase-like pyridoxal phosphate-dependent protein
MAVERLPEGLATPATVVLADRLEHNLTAMAELAADARIALRPHAKTHKCREIARRQIALGARGLSVATVGEAEILTTGDDGTPTQVTDVFIAYPLWVYDDRLRRLGDLADRVSVTVGADSAAGVQRLAPLAGRVAVMVEVDCGMRRTGVRPDAALGVARAAERVGVEVGGVFTFPGHSYLPGNAARAAAEEAAALGTAAELLAAHGFGDLERSGGSTPSISATKAGAVTEIRPGVYVFNDAQQVELGTVGFDDVALVVAATVVSRPEPGRVVLDAGSKELGPDRPGWASGHGRLLDRPDARITGLWEHHAVVAVPEPTPALGDVVAVVPNHVCTAVNLVPELLVVQGGVAADRWAVAARAANR